MRTVKGSPEHFQQVVSAHVVSLWGTCRCGTAVGEGPAAYRAHIESVWRPHALPAGWMVSNGDTVTSETAFGNVKVEIADDTNPHGTRANHGYVRLHDSGDGRFVWHIASGQNGVTPTRDGAIRAAAKAIHEH